MDHVVGKRSNEQGCAKATTFGFHHSPKGTKILKLAEYLFFRRGHLVYSREDNSSTAVVPRKNRGGSPALASMVRGVRSFCPVFWLGGSKVASFVSLNLLNEEEKVLI